MNTKPQLTYQKMVQTTSVNLEKEGCFMAGLCKCTGKGYVGFLINDAV